MARADSVSTKPWAWKRPRSRRARMVVSALNRERTPNPSAVLTFCRVWRSTIRKICRVSREKRALNSGARTSRGLCHGRRPQSRTANPGVALRQDHCAAPLAGHSLYGPEHHRRRRLSQAREYLRGAADFRADFRARPHAPRLPRGLAHRYEARRDLRAARPARGRLDRKGNLFDRAAAQAFILRQVPR
jgi:hypothetical protein